MQATDLARSSSFSNHPHGWVLPDYNGPVTSVSSSPNGALVLTTSQGTARLWNSLTGQEIGVFLGYPSVHIQIESTVRVNVQS